jgi:phospholipid/cholesterol/gamma-HCH transport system permease protein
MPPQSASMDIPLHSRLNGYTTLLGYVFAHRRALKKPPIATVLLRQVNAIGIEALGTIAVLGALCGVLLMTQINALAGGDNETGIRILVWTLVRELAPLLTALIVISRSSAAMATDLALMRLHEEFSALERIGIRPEEYLLLPRVAGMALSVLAATLCFQTIAILSGLIVSSFQSVDFVQELDHVLDLTRPHELLVSAAKSLCFGLAMGVVACYHGAVARPDPAAIPYAGTGAVANSLLLVFLIDVLFTGATLLLP